MTAHSPITSIASLNLEIGVRHAIFAVIINRKTPENTCQTGIFFDASTANHIVLGIAKAVVAGRNLFGRRTPPPQFSKSRVSARFPVPAPAKEGPAMTPNTNTISPGASRDSYAAFPTNVGCAA